MKRPYALAILCYLLIPAVVIACGVVFRLIGPAAFMGMAGVVLILLAACCYFAIKSRVRRFPARIKVWWRLPLEVAAFIGIWSVAYDVVVFKRDVMIALESARTGVPVSTIVERQNESSGMWAFSEGLEQLYLIGLVYLLWPLVFNATAGLLRRRGGTNVQGPITP